MSFSQQHADIAIKFFELILKHSGEWYGERFLLTPWEEECLGTVFGNVDDNGERLKKLAYLELPKKSGKTEFVAGLVLLFLTLDTCKGCEVYGAASVQRQALNVFRAAAAMVEQSPELSRRLRVLRSTHRIIKRSDPNSFYAALAADGDFTDGVNPKFVVADELHRWRTRKQMENWDVLRLGGIARKHQTLTVAITTAGVVNESPLAWRLHEKTQKIQEGVIEDASFYGRIYAADPSDDWADEKTWLKANPSLKQNGGFLDIARIREEYQACLSDQAAQASFRRYYLNLWDQKESRAIDLAQWDQCASDWKAVGLLPKQPDSPVRTYSHEFLKRFFGRPCFPGIDLSLSTDMSAVTLVFPRDDDGFDLLPFFYMPEENIRKKELRDGMPYRKWAEQGFLELHDGGRIDYREVKARIKWATELFDVGDVAFDRYNSREISGDLMDDGFKCFEVPQTCAGLNEATKKLLTCIATGKLQHGAHPVLRWNASCLCTKSDGNDLIRPIKPDRERDHTRIDGISAAVNGISRAIVHIDQSRWVKGEVVI